MHKLIKEQMILRGTRLQVVFNYFPKHRRGTMISPPRIVNYANKNIYCKVVQVVFNVFICIFVNYLIFDFVLILHIHLYFSILVANNTYVFFAMMNIFTIKNDIHLLQWHKKKHEKISLNSWVSIQTCNHCNQVQANIGYLIKLKYLIKLAAYIMRLE